MWFKVKEDITSKSIYVYLYVFLLGKEESESVHQFNESVRQVQDMLDPFNESDSPTIGIPFFDFEKISSSTDGFSEANMLGEGGFGPVYKVRVHIPFKKNIKTCIFNSIISFIIIQIPYIDYNRFLNTPHNLVIF